MIISACHEKSDKLSGETFKFAYIPVMEDEADDPLVITLENKNENEELTITFDNLNKSEKDFITYSTSIRNREIDVEEHSNQSKQLYDFASELQEKLPIALIEK